VFAKAIRPKRAARNTSLGAGFPSLPKKNPGPDSDTRGPAVQNDAGNVSPRIEAGASKHLGKLRANLTFVVAERCCNHLRPPAVTLFIGSSDSRYRRVVGRIIRRAAVYGSARRMGSESTEE
jgi:hypothetical protein